MASEEKRKRERGYRPRCDDETDELGVSAGGMPSIVIDGALENGGRGDRSCVPSLLGDALSDGVADTRDASCAPASSGSALPTRRNPFCTRKS